MMSPQSDTWWHLRAGKEMWARGQVLLVDDFSTVAFGRFWPNHEWLTQLIFYGLFSLGGLPLLTAGAALSVTGAWFLVTRLMRGPADVRLFLAGVALPVWIPAWSVRPHVFSLFFVALFAWLVVRRRYVWLPVMMIVWANLHGGAALGLAVLCGALLSGLLVARELVKPLLFSGLACLIATHLTPLGLAFWPSVVESIALSRADDLQEWRAPLGAIHLPFWALASFFVGSCLVRWRRLDRDTALIAGAAIAILVLAARHARNAAPFTLLAIPAISAMLEGPRRAHSSPESRSGWTTFAVAALAATSVCWISYAWSRPLPSLRWQPMRDEAALAIASCPPPIYNEYNEGGYLLWFVPSHRVFVDSRQDPYPPDFLQNQRATERSADYANTFRTYGINCAVLRPNVPTEVRLREDGWKATYADAEWVVLVKP
jgi:hypothetical protein